MRIESNDRGFVCGKKNDRGLQIDVLINDDGSEAVIEFTPMEHLQGWVKIVHGGILSALLDEAISHIAIYTLKLPVMTAELNIRFKRPAEIGKKLIVIAKLIRSTRRLIIAEAFIESADGTIIAECTGKMIPIRQH